MDVKKLYKDKSKKTIEYMEQVVKQIEKDYGKVELSWNISLQLIADSMEIYFAAIDDIKKRGIYVNDDRNRMAKNPSCAIQNVALQNVSKLLSSFGLTPLSKKKMNGIVDDGESDVLDELINC